MLRVVSAVLALSMMAQAKAPAANPLTADGLRAWLDSAHALESRNKLIHDQMQKQKVGLPPWWPDDVYSQEEEAQQKVDFVDAALPFYQACMTDPQARLMAKMTASTAGQQIAQTSLRTHSQAELEGTSPTAAQTAGEDAAMKNASKVSAEDRRKLAASLTPQERKLAAEVFSPEGIASFRHCADKAYASTTEIMLARQAAAVKAVIEEKRAELMAAETKWIKEHSDKTQ